MTDAETVMQNPDTAGHPTVFADGSTCTVVSLPSVSIGKGTYQPGWQWSQHASALTGKLSAHHIGYILSGSMVVRDAEGAEMTLGQGDAFEVGPGHDAWVVGNQPCVALDVTAR